MATKAKAKKPVGTFPWRKSLYGTAALVGTLALVLQICVDVHFWRAAQYPSGEPITSMIIEAAQATHKQAALDPISKKVYLPDANLVLPPYPKDMPDILYAYLPSIDGADAEADVTLTNAMSVGISKLRNAEGQGLLRRDSSTLFSAVPDLQVCSRGVHVVFGTKSTFSHLEFSKVLADGRTAYVYTEERACPYDLSPLVDYLRDVQSY